MKKKIVLAATAVILTLGTLLCASASASTGSSDAAQSASSSLSSAVSQAAGSGSIFDDASTVMIGIGIALMIIAAIVTLKNKKR